MQLIGGNMMNEIKPTWKIAQQISKRHTFISLKIALPLFFGAILISILILKALGYQNAGLTLHEFYNVHRRVITSILLFIYLVPINFYAIMKIFSAEFQRFQLKIFPK